MAETKVFAISSFNVHNMRTGEINVENPGCWDCNPDYEDQIITCKKCTQRSAQTSVVVVAPTATEAMKIVVNEEKEQYGVESHCVDGDNVTVHFKGCVDPLEFKRRIYCVGINLNPDVLGTCTELDMETNYGCDENGFVNSELGELDPVSEEKAKKDAERTALLQKREALIKAQAKELAEIDAQLADAQLEDAQLANL